MTPCFRGVSARNFAEKLHESSRCFSASFSAKSRGEKKVDCANLREIAFENFCSRIEAFFLG